MPARLSASDGQAAALTGDHLRSRPPDTPGREVYVYLPLADEEATGVQRFGSEMIRALIRDGVECRVIIGQVDGAPAWLEGIPHRVVLPRPHRGLPRSLLAFLRILWLQLILPITAGRRAILLALAHEIAPLPLMRQIAVAHDLTQLRNYAQRGGRIERLRQRLWIFGMKRSEKVIAISDATRRDLIETGGLREDRISVIYEGFDPLIFRPASQEANPARPFLLYAGTLAPNKNLPFLLRAFVTVREAQDVDLVLVGKQEPQAVATLLANIPERLRKSVEFRGFVTDEQLALLMQQCAAFVFPSLNEGFGLAVVEAMACGAPLISSNAGSLAEVVDRGGILLDPNDSDGWTAAIDRVLRDHRFRQELSARALERSSRFSWSEAAQAYRAELIGEGRHGGV